MVHQKGHVYPMNPCLLKGVEMRRFNSSSQSTRHIQKTPCGVQLIFQWAMHKSLYLVLNEYSWWRTPAATTTHLNPKRAASTQPSCGRSTRWWQFTLLFGRSSGFGLSFGLGSHSHHVLVRRDSLHANHVITTSSWLRHHEQIELDYIDK